MRFIGFAIIGLLCASSFIRRHAGGEGWRSWTLPVLVAVAMFTFFSSINFKFT